MTVNIPRIRQCIQDFRFDDLFIDELGWDNYREAMDIVVDKITYTLTAVAEKRGMVAFAVSFIPEHRIRRKIEQQVAKHHRENIIIYVDEAATQQIWQWVRRETGKPLANRERKYFKGHSGENIAQVLASIVFSLEEEDELTIVDVTSRVRAAFDVERVTRQFYDRFKKQHDAFLSFIEGIPDEDLQRWYASVMLNRLMFIYFVQKKGFLDNDYNYLRTRLANTSGNFYREFLCPLFFDGFATKTHSQETTKLLGDVPYLNGGLFLRHQIEEQFGEAIQIENTAFEKLFDFFDQYRWHLDERALRDDTEINPDVLGYIFEKYINQKQMGAYYTKEDITEYIGKNTIIPYLFGEAEQAVEIAFRGEHSVWDLLAEDPDRYIYEAVRHGTENVLPAHIAAGIDDVSKREDWNSPAPQEYGLPTEIWRETVARHTRYKELKATIARGDIRQINDLINHNLDIQQFAQDVIAYTDSSDVVRAFWHAINSVTVLDPTCGSGAFLFAALNILEPLYEACLERMERFVDESPPSDGQSAYPYSDFREIMDRIDQHPNRIYFILKRIIIQNLYGVDIMEEAVEIAKLRLFLKLMAQIEKKANIEPLPDIDFNIRAGNTLVGFATQGEVHRALTYTQGGQGKLLFGEDQATLAEIERKAKEIDASFTDFRLRQTEVGGDAPPEDKAKIKTLLNELGSELDNLLAGQYGVDSTNSKKYVKWLKSHEPFHWFVEFYGVLSSGGFDVILGNPPYVEYRLVKDDYTLNNDYYESINSNNLYAFCMERSVQLISGNGWFGMIVPTSVIGLDRTSSLRDVLLAHLEFHSCSTYGIRPSKLFDGVDQRLCIYLGKSGESRSPIIQTTKHHFWYSDERAQLFESLEYVEGFNHTRLQRFPQIPNKYGAKVLEKLEEHNNRTIVNYYSSGANASIMHYHRSPRYWIRAIDFEPHFKSPTSTRSVHHFRDLKFADTLTSKSIGAILNSSLFYFWFISLGNGRNITGTDIEEFPVGTLSDSLLAELPPIFDRLMDDYRDNSIIRVRADQEYQEFYQSKSKSIMDEIDALLATHYEFTKDELDYIVNYDIKYRMGDELFDD